MSDVEILLVSLSEAAKNGNVDKLKEVLAVCSQELVNDSSASSSGYTPLHYAAWNGMGKSVELLAAAKADVNAADKYGRTPLHLAARMGMIAVIEKLVALGARIEVRQQLSASPLHYAALEGHTAACQKLLKLRANLHAVNGAGKTAIMLAESRDHHKTIEYLKHAAGKHLAPPASNSEREWTM
uniref:Uncharacterized protein n=1 Tax=Guillardia theta TaxID=55529 RepID=A0A7S4NRW3_GUITH|mmetsp:Transcript_30674/g.98706  ORF Transcript_30674/g.98706 Transcript_30674/m.98706 type:complete len:184 (+) Transcript_30674:33-584(+)